jgi:hypothetical protein
MPTMMITGRAIAGDARMKAFHRLSVEGVVAAGS